MTMMMMTNCLIRTHIGQVIPGYRYIEPGEITGDDEDNDLDGGGGGGGSDDTIFAFYGSLFLFYPSLLLSWMFEHAGLDTRCFLASYMHVFCIFVFELVQHN